MAEREVRVHRRGGEVRVNKRGLAEAGGSCVGGDRPKSEEV